MCNTLMKSILKRVWTIVQLLIILEICVYMCKRINKFGDHIGKPGYDAVLYKYKIVYFFVVKSSTASHLHWSRPSTSLFLLFTKYASLEYNPCLHNLTRAGYAMLLSRYKYRPKLLERQFCLGFIY
jgi:hypothetical protein